MLRNITTADSQIETAQHHGAQSGRGNLYGMHCRTAVGTSIVGTVK